MSSKGYRAGHGFAVFTAALLCLASPAASTPEERIIVELDELYAQIRREERLERGESPLRARYFELLRKIPISRSEYAAYKYKLLKLPAPPAAPTAAPTSVPTSAPTSEMAPTPSVPTPAPTSETAAPTTAPPPTFPPNAERPTFSPKVVEELAPPPPQRFDEPDRAVSFQMVLPTERPTGEPVAASSVHEDGGESAPAIRPAPAPYLIALRAKSSAPLFKTTAPAETPRAVEVVHPRGATRVPRADSPGAFVASLKAFTIEATEADLTGTVTTEASPLPTRETDTFVPTFGPVLESDSAPETPVTLSAPETQQAPSSETPALLARLRARAGSSKSPKNGGAVPALAADRLLALLRGSMLALGHRLLAQLPRPASEASASARAAPVPSAVLAGFGDGRRFAAEGDDVTAFLVGIGAAFGALALGVGGAFWLLARRRDDEEEANV